MRIRVGDWGDRIGDIGWWRWGWWGRTMENAEGRQEEEGYKGGDEIVGRLARGEWIISLQGVGSMEG